MAHIKGLIINLILCYWPSLFKLKGFLKEFVTPLIKATKGNQRKEFYTVQDFKTFANNNELTEWVIKYYKGLGTSTDEEAQEYFKNLKQHLINFKFVGREDVDAIELCFTDNRVEDRKNWLLNYNIDTFVDHNQKELQYKDFINKELIHYSMNDTIRSIPQLIDGFKPGQRKVLYSCFIRNLISELKVVQLGGFISEHSGYNHGDINIQNTIIGMAQNFIGSSNINLLEPNGQFGSRAMGGKDHAQARYISTKLSKITRYIYPELDDHTLKYQEDNGQMIEPEYYVPIIPMILINGATGIGTGWSTSIDCYNPRDLVEQIKRKIKGQELIKLKPWYKFFDGVIEEDSKSGYIIKGLVELDIENDKAIIKELPVGKWTNDYKDWLEKQIQSEDSKIQIININEYHTKHKIHFELDLAEGYAAQINDPLNEFNLISTSQTTNMVLFDSNSKIHKYETVNQIIEEFYKVRLQYYQKRKEFILSKLQREVQIIEEKCRFILMVTKDQIKLRNVKYAEVFAQLEKNNFVKFSQLTQVKSTKLKAFGDKKARKKVVSGASEAEQKKESEYNYLLSLPFYSLTTEKVLQLNEYSKQKKAQMSKIYYLSPLMMWIEDLDNFLRVLSELELEELAIINKGERGPKQQQQVKNKKKPKKQVQQQEQQNQRKRGRSQKQTKDTSGQAKNKRRQSNGSIDQNEQKFNFLQQGKRGDLQQGYFTTGPQRKNRKIIDDD